MSTKKPVLIKKHSFQLINFIKTLLDESSQMLIRHGENKIDAARASRIFVIEISRRLTGDAIYISKGTFIDVKLKYHQIRKAFQNGANLEQLAKEYSLTTRRIRDILYKVKDDTKLKASTTGIIDIVVVATAMFIHAGCEREEAVDATRGLLAVISAKHGGESVFLPSLTSTERLIRNIDINQQFQAGKSIRSLVEQFSMSAEDINQIIANYPVAPLPSARGLPDIRRKVQILTGDFSGYPEIHLLLGEVIERISIVENIIAVLSAERKTN